MTSRNRVSMAIAATAVLAFGGAVLAAQSGPSGTRPALSETFAKVPLAFEPNVGQADPAARFLARAPGRLIFLAPGEVVLVADSEALGRSGQERFTPAPESVRLDVARIALSGADPGAKMSALDPRPGRSSYLTGNDPEKWQRDVPSYGKVLWKDAYPGIDVLFYGRDGQLEFDYVLRPGADPGAIALTAKGADALSLTPEGDLSIRVGGTDFYFKRPDCYQELNGKRVPVEGAYRLDGSRVSLSLGAYDRSRALVVDPVLVYSTYFGGSGTDYAYGLTRSPAGGVYITGETLSLNLPLKDPGQSLLWGGYDAYVTHFNANGSDIVYSTYLGGSSTDIGFSIAVDGAGAMYVTGYTSSSNFPIVPGIQPAKAGGIDAFLTKINPSGQTLDYSTYLGGTGSDYCYGLAIDASGNAYISGNTASNNWPTYLPLQGSLTGTSCAFAAKVNSTGSALVYSTYLGGSGADGAVSLALDSAGAVYLTGVTTSTDFPVLNAFQPVYSSSEDAFVSKINPAGSALVYSTYLGGNALDVGWKIALDSAGAAYVVGLTNSTNFPLLHPIQSTTAGGNDGFVAKLGPSGSALVYSTYLGGSGTDGATALAVDALGCAYVGGNTSSSNFPTVSPIQAALAGGSDAFVTKFTPSGTAFVYSTFLGGSGADTAYAMSVDSSGNAYVAGMTNSTNFPTAAPYQAANAGNSDAFVTKIGPALACNASASPTSGSAPLTVTFAGEAASGNPPYTYAWDFGDGSTGSGQSASHAYNTGGSFNARLTVTDTLANTAQDNHLTITVAPPATLTVNASATPLSGNAPLNVAFSAAAAGGIPPYTYLWNFGDGGAGTGQSTSHSYDTQGTYGVTCTAVDSVATTASDTHITVDVAPPLPLTLGISANPTTGVAPLDVSFTAEPAGGVPPYALTWSFGDGGSGTGLSITHTYATGGTYSVQAALSDSKGATTSATTTIVVINPPVITSMKKQGNPFRLVVYGTNFHSNCTIKIDGAAVPQTQYKDPTKAVAKKGSALKVMAPKGVPFNVTITNNDDGGTSSTFTFSY